MGSKWGRSKCLSTGASAVRSGESGRIATSRTMQRSMRASLTLALVAASVLLLHTESFAQVAAAKGSDQSLTFDEKPVKDPVASDMSDIAGVSSNEKRADDAEKPAAAKTAGASSRASLQAASDAAGANGDADAPEAAGGDEPPQNAQAAARLPGESAEIAEIGHEALIDELLRRMASPDERTRLEAGLALRKSAKLSDVENLVKILKRGNNKDKQLFLIETLGGLQDRRAGEALRFEVEHGDIDTKRAAVSALGNLNFNWPIPVLVRVLRRADDEELRKRAASSLGQIGSTQAIYAIRTSLASLEDSVGAKNAAYWALEKARGEVDDEQIDTKMPRGRRLQLFYKGTKYFFYHPANRRGAAVNKVGLRPWLLVCVHDSDLRSEELFNICWRAGRKRQMAVLVPVIDNMRFPDYGTFNIRGQRFDKRLLELIEHVGEHAALTVREIYMFGYGQGGDFVQRFAMSYPKRIARAAFESNTYTAPDPESYFPRGLNRSPLAPDVAVDMYSFLKADLAVILRKNSETLREGKDYIEALQHFADINGLRGRLASRQVDVKFEIWAEAEKFLFALD